jgi:NADPH:quinone reductase-like Zn-dependent oxidoreductase
MKAYELQQKDGFDSLTRVDRPAQDLGPTQVRVRVRAVSLNFRDLTMARLARKRSKPIVPVSDGAGEVVAVGDRVTRRTVGDRVAASFFPTWLDGDLDDSHHANSLGGTIDGMLREEVVLDERAWVPIPDALSFEEAATLPCAGVTAWHALFEAHPLRPGEIVLLQGTGGVSIFALQLARAAGARVILTSSSDEKRERARELGAEHTIDYKKTPAWGEAARTWTGGRGVDVAVEVGGPGTLDQTVAALRYGGTISILGVLTGTKGEVNTYAIFHKAAHIHGIYVGSVRMFEALSRALVAAGIHPIIDRVFGFDEARAAYEHLASGSHFGKVVIRLP